LESYLHRVVCLKHQFFDSPTRIFLQDANYITTLSARVELVQYLARPNLPLMQSLSVSIFELISA
jgi:hypothetical protein